MGTCYLVHLYLSTQTHTLFLCVCVLYSLLISYQLDCLMFECCISRNAHSFLVLFMYLIIIIILIYYSDTSYFLFLLGPNKKMNCLDCFIFRTKLKGIEMNNECILQYLQRDMLVGLHSSGFSIKIPYLALPF